MLLNKYFSLGPVPKYLILCIVLVILKCIKDYANKLIGQMYTKLV